MPAQGESAAERFVATLITVPLGFGAALIDELPTRVETARRHVALARFIGKMTVEYAVRELQRHVTTASAPDAVVAPAAVVLDAAVVPDVPEMPDVPDHVPSAELALPDYDQLPAAHIVGKLAGLTAGERADIEAYETAHRHRRTVLGKLDQLRAGDLA